MTSFQTVYDSFMSKMLEDDWTGWTQEEINQDIFKLLEEAITWFKFPRKSLEINTTEETFVEDLDNEEIQILSVYMKCIWLDRTILSWENVKPLYAERDFSQANLIDKFRQLYIAERKYAEKLEANYYRSIKGKPYLYRNFASNG